MNNDAMDIQRIHTRMNCQWERLTKMILIQVMLFFLLSVAIVVVAFRIVQLQDEVNELKSRQTQQK